MLALVLAAWAHGGSHTAPPAPPPAASPAAPGWTEREGPWTAGHYADVAVGSSGTHVIWLEGGALKYQHLGGPVESVASSVESGDNGQIRPEIALDGKGAPFIAFAGSGHVWLARREGGWIPRQVDHARSGDRGLLALAVLDDIPTVVWLDTRAAPAEHRAAVWTGSGNLDTEIYGGGADGVCMCCKPALALRGSEMWLAFRDADGPKREIRALSLAKSWWTDRGEVTHGGWSPGGCPSDGPAIGPDAIYVSDARDGRRRIWRADAKGETALPLLDAAREAVQPRVVADGSVVTWVEVGSGDATLVMLEGGQPMAVAHVPGTIEPGDPVVVGRELWVPVESGHARILVQEPPGR